MGLLYKEILISSSGANSGGFSTMYQIETISRARYWICANNGTGSQSVELRKSVDGGFTWKRIAVLNNGNLPRQLAVWYDRWSGLNSGYICVAYCLDTTLDVRFITIDTENNDAISTETILFTGVSPTNNGHLSIVRAQGGNVDCKYCIDNGVEGGFSRLLNANFPNGAWATRTINEALAASDQMILMPGFAADPNDIMAFFWDASSNEVSVQKYDDSADTWSESGNVAGMVETIPGGNESPYMSALPDIANSRNLLVAWTQANLAGAKLRCWKVSDSSMTEVTNIISSSGGNQGQCVIAMNVTTGDWHVAYSGKENGTELYPGEMNMYSKKSTDQGVTWGEEIQMTGYITPWDGSKHWKTGKLAVNPRFVDYFEVAFSTSEQVNNFRLTKALRDETLRGAGIAV